MTVHGNASFGIRSHSNVPFAALNSPIGQVLKLSVTSGHYFSRATCTARSNLPVVPLEQEEPCVVRTVQRLDSSCRMSIVEYRDPADCTFTGNAHFVPCAPATHAHRSASQLRPKCAGIEDDRALRKSPAAAWRFHSKRLNKNCDWASQCRTDYCPRAEPHTAQPHPSRRRGPRRRSRRTASGHFSLTTECRRRYSRAARPATLSGRRDTKGRGAPLERLDRGGA